MARHNIEEKERQELKHTHPWAAKAQGEGDKHRQGLGSKKGSAPLERGLIGMHCGFVAGCCAGIATTPLDAAKTRIMLTVLAART